MVLIHYKKTDYNQFFFECPAVSPIDIAIEDLVKVNNLRITIDSLSVCIEELAKLGPLKSEDIRGLTDDLIPDEEGKVGDAKKPTPKP